MEDPSRSNSGRQVHGVETCDDIVYDYDKGTDDDRDREVNLKVKSALEGVKSFPFKRIIFQFWRPLDDGGRLVLESFRNAYAVSPYDRLLRDKYRVCSTKYLFSIIDEGHNPNPNPAWIISGGPVVTAFLNHFPEVVLDLRVHQGSPLAVCALECELTCCVMLPVFHASECVGVRVGLSIYHVQGSCSYKAADLEPAKIEIKKVLEIACESHDLTLGQVWIPYETNNAFVWSTHSGDVDYALEFFWPCSRNHLILLETLLLTLSKYLPSFKFASGEQLGDELFVVDVENSSLSKILTGNKLSEASPKASNQSPLTNINNLEADDDDLAILATYRNESMLFYLRSSSTFENVMEKLNKEFELDLARTYKVEYEVSPAQWSSLACLESCRRIEDMGLVKLLVLATVGEVGWRWRTNT
ncbi:hypothetical protein L1987_08838 [Smallanthus sonchifolius]|uniref:Uncharacterized protein n=1 Tax=Smallanthus sonchifolius TaxID=185202 RepID=A0ACB9JLB9_9ASTR|nr:hypothetical protein L1987_08838 [Smallanthus sonchifolius]